MKKAAQKMDFEKAAEVRDKLSALRSHLMNLLDGNLGAH